MSKSKAVAATFTAAALLAGAAATPASAQSSSSSSSKPNYYDPLPQHEVPPKRPFEGSYTGSAPISLAIAALATAAAVQAIVDFVPPVRAAVDQAAVQLGLTHVVGSSAGNRIFPAEEVQKLIDDLLRQAMTLLP